MWGKVGGSPGATKTRINVLIVFPEHPVAPYAAGAQAVPIPYEALAGELDPVGPLGLYAKQSRDTLAS